MGDSSVKTDYLVLAVHEGEFEGTVLVAEDSHYEGPLHARGRVELSAGALAVMNSNDW